MNLDGDWNKASMHHQGRHPYAYHEYVLENMKNIDRIAAGDKSIFLEKFEELKRTIIDNEDMLYKNYWK